MSVLCELEDFYLNFKCEKQIIGKSVENRPIYCFCVKKSEYPVVIAQYAIHAREYITTYLAMRQIQDFYLSGKRGTVYFIPALNPDGIVIANNINPLYKANANGVDLNVNFDARWGTGEFNLRVKGEQNYIGEAPFSQPETRAIRDFTLKVKPHATISYHSKGEEIYYEFFQTGNALKRDRAIAQKLSSVTGYAVKSTPNSAGGYKDWCIEKLKIPAFTIEVGSDELSHPIGVRHLEQIYKANKSVITTLTENI